MKLISTLTFGLTLLLSAHITHAQLASVQEFNWDSFDALLKANVKPSKKENIDVNLVDYTTLKSSKAFYDIAHRLDQYDPSHLSGTAKITFYINAYNYFALKMVADNYPLDSIKDLGNILFPVWKKDAGKINGQVVSLDQLEHSILRKLNEPAIHFAIVCASLSCPDLRAEAYSTERLSQQLRDQLVRFLKQRKGKQIAGEGEDQTLYLSKIFQWFESDFDDAGGVINYLVEYDPSVKPFAEFESLDYNWQVNSQ